MSHLSKMLVPLWLVAAALCMLPVLSSIAQEKEKEKEKEKAPKTEKDKKSKTATEWAELTSKSGTLKKVDNKKKKVSEDPIRITFTSESESVRIKWTTKQLEGERTPGLLQMTLFRKKEETRAERPGSKRTEKEMDKDKDDARQNYQRVDRVGQSRGVSEGSKIVKTGKGDFHIELEGEAIEWEISVEAPDKKPAE